MYGWLLESVQHFIVEECGEEIWETILREAGARNTVFSATQQYPDTLMLRLASALARFLNKDPNSPSPSRPSSPGPRKLSLKSKPSWRSASVNTDGRVGFRCPFTATNALTAATKKEIHAYTSSEELAAQTLSVERINEEVELEISKNKALNRRSLGIKLEHHNTINVVELPSSPINGETQNEKESNPLLESSLTSEDKTQTSLKCGKNRKSSTAEPSTNKEPMCPKDSKTTSPVTSSPERKTSILKSPKTYKSTATVEEICQSESKTSSPTTSSPERKTSSILKSPKANKTIAIAGSSNSEGEKTSEPMSPVSFNSEGKPALKPIRVRKSSVTVALDVYRRRGSGVPVRPRLNSLSHINVSGDKLSVLREKFGTPEKVMHFFGRCFVKFFSNYGYDTMIRATGRYFCTFLQSVDSIHQRMRFTFPRMRSPSMQLTRSHIHGAELVYSSTRTGFTHYLMGQLYEIAEDIFSLKLKVSIVKESMEGSYYNAVLRLEFDNSDYVQSQTLRKNLPCPLPSVPVSLFLQLFPFGVLLDRKMKIISAGVKLIESWGGPYDRIEKQPISEILRLRKPKVSFTWDKVVTMQTMIFELELMRWRGRVAGDARRGSQGARAVLFKGPIYFLQEIDALIFLCCPIFNDLEELQQADLFLADMNGHGLSKEMLLQGWQHLSRLELLFEKAEGRSLSLEKSCRLRDQWKSKGDQLVYSMIPKSLAFHLRAGKDPIAACQAYDSVTVMFCGLQVGEAGTRADVMQTVDYINDVYSRIDRLLDSHRVYKVETVGTVYMLVAGAPERARAHAASAAGAALAISRALPMLTIGVHSGPCVAGVLGLKLPRFCLVGDTVNTASRMQTTSEPGRVHVSTQTANELPARFRLRRRGLIKVKGKGMMETFWLEGELEEDDQDEALQLFSALCGDN